MCAQHNRLSDHFLTFLFFNGCCIFLYFPFLFLLIIYCDSMEMFACESHSPTLRLTLLFVCNFRCFSYFLLLCSACLTLSCPHPRLSCHHTHLHIQMQAYVHIFHGHLITFIIKINFMYICIDNSNCMYVCISVCIYK